MPEVELFDSENQFDSHRLSRKCRVLTWDFSFPCRCYTQTDNNAWGLFETPAILEQVSASSRQNVCKVLSILGKLMLTQRTEAQRKSAPRKVRKLTPAARKGAGPERSAGPTPVGGWRAGPDLSQRSIPRLSRFAETRAREKRRRAKDSHDTLSKLSRCGAWILPRGELSMIHEFARPWRAAPGSGPHTSWISCAPSPRSARLWYRSALSQPP